MQRAASVHGQGDMELLQAFLAEQDQSQRQNHSPNDGRQVHLLRTQERNRIPRHHDYSHCRRPKRHSGEGGVL